MDLKKAYSKIDNLCCLNSSNNSNFFDAYKDTHDEDFCKDANEMIDALEIIKNVVDTMTQSLLLSLKYNVRVFHSNMLDEVHEFETLQAARDYAAKQKDFCLISMAIEEWFGEEDEKQE